MKDLKSYLTVGLLLLFVGLTHWWGSQIVSHVWLSLVMRWLTIGGLCYIGSRQNKLTNWIMISMVVGLETGIDFPSVAQNMGIFSSVFIQLIKTVIAPLLFGTLVMGIASHGNLKQVGRMGGKALIYFEIATTFALVIGLLAINFTKAGERVVHKESVSNIANLPATETAVNIDSVKGTYQLVYHGQALTPATPAIKQDWKKSYCTLFLKTLLRWYTTAPYFRS